MTLSDYYHGVFVPGRAGRLTRATMADYDCQWRNRIAPAFGRLPLDGIDHRDVQGWVLSMPRPTAEHAVRTLRAILRAAWEDGLLDAEPMRKPLRYPPCTSARPVLWTPAEVARAADVLHGHPLEPAWLLMVGGGLRRSEALAATWDRIRPASTPSGSVAALVDVDAALTERDGLKQPKNGYSRRTAVVAPPFAARLLDLHGAPLLPCSVSRVPGVWKRLWSDRSGHTDPYAGAMSSAGVPWLELRLMRAVHETMMQQAGVLDTLNSRMHGRSNVSTGYRHYLNPADAAYLSAGDALAALMDSAR